MELGRSSYTFGILIFLLITVACDQPRSPRQELSRSRLDSISYCDNPCDSIFVLNDLVKSSIADSSMLSDISRLYWSCNKPQEAIEFTRKRLLAGTGNLTNEERVLLMECFRQLGIYDSSMYYLSKIELEGSWNTEKRKAWEMQIAYDCRKFKECIDFAFELLLLDGKYANDTLNMPNVYVALSYKNLGDTISYKSYARKHAPELLEN